jgi:hypothetical protein
MTAERQHARYKTMSQQPSAPHGVNSFSPAELHTQLIQIVIEYETPLQRKYYHIRYAGVMRSLFLIGPLVW